MSKNSLKYFAFGLIVDLVLYVLIPHLWANYQECLGAGHTKRYCAKTHLVR